MSLVSVGVGARCLYSWRSGSQEELQRALVTLGGSQVVDTASPWGLSVSLFVGKPTELPTGAAKEFFVVSFDYADKRYMLARDQIIEGSSDLLEIKDKWRWYGVRQTVTIKGLAFELGDFTVRFGVPTLNHQSKVPVLDVEYKPCTVVGGQQHCTKLAAELLSCLGLAEQLVLCQAEYQGMASLPSMYTPHHTVVQYVGFLRSHGLLKSS